MPSTAALAARIPTDTDRALATYIRNVRQAMFDNLPADTARATANEIVFSCMASIICSHRNGEPVSDLAAELLENG